MNLTKVEMGNLQGHCEAMIPQYLAESKGLARETAIE
jgi:hypothetical protein